jgi:hypothetical protein
MQRAAWEQGVAAQALLELGDTDLVILMAREARKVVDLPRARAFLGAGVSLCVMIGAALLTSGLGITVQAAAGVLAFSVTAFAARAVTREEFRFLLERLV